MVVEVNSMPALRLHWLLTACNGLPLTCTVRFSCCYFG
jgi:hypothetical protein